IVVLENIHRHLKSGKTPVRAAYDGGREVWGAILASTLTTIAVFVPILTVQEEAGQLFRDIAIAIVGAVTLSLIVSITVIPAACSLWLRPHDAGTHGPVYRALDNLFGLVPLCHHLTNFIARAVYWLMTGWRGWTIRPAVILVMTAASLIGAAVLMPPMDYLPAGNRNLVFGGMQTPPGLSVDQFVRLAQSIEGVVGPYVTASDEDVADLPKIPKGFGGMDGQWPPVGVENFFIGAFDGGMFVGGTSRDEKRVKPVGDLLNMSIQTLPDVYGGASQASLFGRGVGGNNAINIEISGPKLDKVVAAASALQGALFGSGEYSPTQVQASPGNYANPQQEYQIRIKQAGEELGLRPDTVGTVIRSLIDGAFVGDFRGQNRTIDIRLLPRGGRLTTLDQVRDMPLATPDGRIVPLDTLVEITPGLAQQEVQRIEELPSVTINVTPPDGKPLEEAMTELNDKYLAPLSQRGLIDRTMRVRLEGTAAKLDEVRAALIGRAPLTGTPRTSVQKALDVLGWIVLATGLALGVFVAIRAVHRRRPAMAWGVFGVVCLGALGAAILMGFADQPQLTTARFIWALAVTYLLMCALFESFLYPLVIMFTVPLAIVGGFAGLRIVHDYTRSNDLLSTQNLDVLTMLGFVILVGVVVNNAILIVHQALNHMRGDEDSLEGSTLIADPMRAIAESVRTRIRPVFMSTLTSVGGMAPLVLFPGSGSELYRGLGSVVVGGLICATMFTLFLVPLLFSLVIQMETGFREAFRKADGGGSASTGATRKTTPVRQAEHEPEPEPALARAAVRSAPSTS
ncbi:MAG: efflux RND transporter permease subunit, partial [Phycisphaerales bacterium]|nr:efflux RND transporter permease subunit [Phycisphaerales bacterium]